MPNNESTEQSVANSLQETGGIPQITVSMEVSGMTQTPVDRTLSIRDMAADAKSVGDAIANLQEAISDNAEEIAAIEQWTGEDIKVNSNPTSQTIAQALSDITGDAYPVGSIYMTTLTTPPTFNGTWQEIAITATWNQLKTGKRNYAALEEGDTGGTVHFWLRIE